MNVVNYDKEMLKIKSAAEKEGKRLKLLLHVCCAPCSSAAIEKLKDFCDVTAYFYNPNLDGEIEFTKRKDEAARLCKEWNIPFVFEDYNAADFFDAVKGYEDFPEGSKRCFICYKLRIEKTAEYAKNNNFEYFTTSLTLSPLKNAEKINAIGFELQEKYGVKFLPSDFKKRNGYLRSIELSKTYGLYRQNYCGCEFSKNKTV